MFPQRIVCLTEETTETLYLLEEEHRIVGISGFTVRPARARKEKPRVAAFTTAHIDKIVNLRPDLVLGFSDLQADIMADLVRRGVAVHVFNQRSVHGIFQMIRMLGGMLGCDTKAARLAARLQSGMDAVALLAQALPHKPRIYFEEWNDPLIAGIRWVSELIVLSGGIDCFAELAIEPLAKNRIIADPTEVVRRQPDIILGSWCGKKFQPQAVSARPSWAEVPAVRNGDVFEIKSPLILQPGPAALTDGLLSIHRRVAEWARRQAA